MDIIFILTSLFEKILCIIKAAKI